MSKAKILIVEDSFIVAYHLQTTLEGEGYEVINKFDTGEAAIAFVEHTKPDLILMDIMLNGELDGIQTANTIKSSYGLPVIYITALSDRDTIARAKITEPYGYLTKPFEDREIFTVIEMALYKHEIELRLKQSEEKYFSTINSISDAVIAIDREYNVTYMNPTAIALTQLTLKEATGKSILKVLKLKDEQTNEISINPIQCTLSSRGHNRMPEDLLLIGKQGTEVPIGESSLSPLLDIRGDFIGLIVVFKDMTENRQHQLLKQRLEQGRIAAIIEGQEHERARIAKDLHDGLGQMLNAIKMNVKTVINDKSEATVIAKLMDEAIHESIRISENLLPSKLKDFGLGVCLRSLCTTIEKTTDANINFEIDDHDVQISQSQKINMYRIAQEGINNAMKHSRANKISVQLNHEPKSLRLSIEDDGIGFQIGNQNSVGHRGLGNMRDRASIMGGKFTIESDTRRGTLVVVEIPIKNENGKV